MRSGTKLTPNRVAAAVAGKGCPICLDLVEIRSAVALNPCLHAYCIECIRRWSNSKLKCPLCNANFSSWFCKIGSKTFREENLPSPDRGKKVGSVSQNDEFRRWRMHRAQFNKRLFRRQPQQGVLPIQRSFVWESNENPIVVAERVRQWRASIYTQRLQAVPSRDKNGLPKQIVRNNGVREMLLARIEPWIHRELQAVLEDPDPTVIVHVATSLFILHQIKLHENNLREPEVGEDDFLAPLRRFLLESTELFWHELQCFAESTFSLETYDTRTIYRRMN